MRTRSSRDSPNCKHNRLSRKSSLKVLKKPKRKKLFHLNKAKKKGERHCQLCSKTKKLNRPHLYNSVSRLSAEFSRWCLIRCAIYNLEKHSSESSPTLAEVESTEDDFNSTTAGVLTRKTVDNPSSFAGRGSVSEDALSRLKFKLQASEPGSRFQSEIGGLKNPPSDG